MSVKGQSLGYFGSSVALWPSSLHPPRFVDDEDGLAVAAKVMETETCGSVRKVLILQAMDTVAAVVVVVGALLLLQQQ